MKNDNCSSKHKCCKTSNYIFCRLGYYVKEFTNGLPYLCVCLLIRVRLWPIGRYKTKKSNTETRHCETMKSNLVLHSVLYRTSCLGAFPHLISNKLSINRGIQDCVECLSPQIVIFILDYVFDFRFGFHADSY